MARPPKRTANGNGAANGRRRRNGVRAKVPPVPAPGRCILQVRRTDVVGNAPAALSLADGELAVEMAEPGSPKLWVGVPTVIDPAGQRLFLMGGGAAWVAGPGYIQFAPLMFQWGVSNMPAGTPGLYQNQLVTFPLPFSAPPFIVLLTNATVPDPPTGPPPWDMPSGVLVWDMAAWATDPSFRVVATTAVDFTWRTAMLGQALDANWQAIGPL